MHTWKKYHLKSYRLFLKTIGYTKDRTSRNLFRLFQFAIYASIFVVIINLFSLFAKDTNFGTWGDFFGGVLNPILTFLTFMGLLITIVLQQTELKESRKEFKRSADALLEQSKSLRIQNFENTFFNMLDLHNNIVSDIQLGTQKGKQAIYALSRDIQNLQSFYSSYKQPHIDLGHYFRNIYQILKLIEISEISEKKFYTNLLRAQLSTSELKLLFYNCLSDYGKEKTKPLLEKYQFLEPLTIDSIYSKQDILNYDKNIFGENKDSLSYIDSLKS